MAAEHVTLNPLQGRFRLDQPVGKAVVQRMVYFGDGIKYIPCQPAVSRSRLD
jgi:hypothetical protein